VPALLIPVGLTLAGLHVLLLPRHG
jgi:hypothetical protein